MGLLQKRRAAPWGNGYTTFLHKFNDNRTYECHSPKAFLYHFSLFNLAC